MAARALNALSGNGIVKRDYFRSLFEYHRGQTMRFSRDVGNPGNRTRQSIWISIWIDRGRGNQCTTLAPPPQCSGREPNSNLFYASPEILLVG